MLAILAVTCHRGPWFAETPRKPRTQTETKSEKHANVRRYRERLRAKGLRPVTIWVPDTRAPGFDEECRRQSAGAAQGVAERDFEAWECGQAFDDWKD
jgi:hypothetical protein